MKNKTRINAIDIIRTAKEYGLTEEETKSMFFSNIHELGEEVMRVVLAVIASAIIIEIINKIKNETQK